MINSVSVVAQTVANNANVLFPVDRIRTRSCQCACKGWLAHDLGSGIFTLTKEGIYEVEYNANITAGAAGAIFLELEQNGEPIGGTKAIYTVATAEALGHVSASTLVRVPCGASMTITLGNNSGLGITVQDANIIIKKVA